MNDLIFFPIKNYNVNFIIPKYIMIYEPIRDLYIGLYLFEKNCYSNLIILKFLIGHSMFIQFNFLNISSPLKNH